MVTTPAYFVFEGKNRFGESAWFVGIEGIATTAYRQGPWNTEAAARETVARWSNPDTTRARGFRSIDIRPTRSISDMDDSDPTAL